MLKRKMRGKLTAALTAMMIENYPPRGHLSVWIEQQKLPPID